MRVRIPSDDLAGSETLQINSHVKNQFGLWI
jgi:hypothetical protein